MGFMSETVIVAGSDAYNLAGDVASRGIFMKNTIMGLVMSGSDRLGKQMVDAHIAGPATSYRRFGKWAEKSGYNNRVGNYEGMTFVQSSLSAAGLEFMAPTRAGYERRLITFSVDVMNLSLLAQSYIMRVRPERSSMKFTVEQEMDLQYRIGMRLLQVYVPTGRLILTYEDGWVEIFTPPNVNLASGETVAYAYYEERPLPRTTQSDTAVTYVSSASALPDTSGWIGNPTPTFKQASASQKVVTVVTHSDGALGVNDTTYVPMTFSYTSIEGTATKVYEEPATNFTAGVETTVKQLMSTQVDFDYVTTTDTTTTTSGTAPNVVTTTTTITKTTPVPLVQYGWSRMTTVVRNDPWGQPILAIYQKGTGAYGDSVVFTAQRSTAKFYPVIPVRRFNVFVEKDTFPEQYDWNKKACFKAYGSRRKYDQVVKSLKSSESIKDVDHAWMVFGVSLGTKQRDGLDYLYEFFKNMADSTPTVATHLRGADEYQAAWENFVIDVEAAAAYDPESGQSSKPRPTPPIVQQYNFSVNARRGLEDWEYNVNIASKGGKKFVGTGMHARAGGKIGRSWVYHKRTLGIIVPRYNGGGDGETGYYTYEPSSTPVIAFGRQINANLWEEYEFFDLIHTNNVYGGKTVVTLAAAAIASNNENSGFIIPLHEAVFNDVGLIRRTQLSMECAFLVLNYYEKQKIPWYATGFFKIIMVIVIIVISVIMPPAGAASGGVLGTNMAVGAALGFAGTAAIVAGAIANALAGALIAAVISKASTAIFGDKLGGLIGSIISMVVIGMANNSGQPFDLSNAWTEMTKAPNLLKLTMSGINAYSDHVMGKAKDLNDQTQEMMASYNRQIKEINDLTSELLGGSGVDPMLIAEATRYVTESPDEFLTRTMMTGTEVAETSISLVENFADIQLKLPYTG